MSSNNTQKNDFEGLKDLDLNPDDLENAKQARIEARSIMNALEPHHILGWPHLISLLESCLENANLYVITSQRIKNLH